MESQQKILEMYFEFSNPAKNLGPIADTMDKIDSEIFFSRKLESNWNLGNQSSYLKNRGL
jgi:hypothetical protein